MSIVRLTPVFAQTLLVQRASSSDLDFQAIFLSVCASIQSSHSPFFSLDPVSFTLLRWLSKQEEHQKWAVDALSTYQWVTDCFLTPSIGKHWLSISTRLCLLLADVNTADTTFWRERASNAALQLIEQFGHIRKPSKHKNFNPLDLGDILNVTECLLVVHGMVEGAMLERLLLSVLKAAESDVPVALQTLSRLSSLFDSPSLRCLTLLFQFLLCSFV